LITDHSAYKQICIHLNLCAVFVELLLNFIFALFALLLKFRFDILCVLFELTLQLVNLRLIAILSSKRNFDSVAFLNLLERFELTFSVLLHELFDLLVAIFLQLLQLGVALSHEVGDFLRNRDFNHFLLHYFAEVRARDVHWLLRGR
jgi:hypothetical protein